MSAIFSDWAPKFAIFLVLFLVQTFTNEQSKSWTSNLQYKDFYRNFDLVKEKWKLILHIFYYLQNLKQKGLIHLH